MLKIIGILIITGAATLGGYECTASLKKRIIALDSIIKMLDSLQAKITYFNLSLNDFLNEYSEPFLDSTDFLKKAKESGLTSALVAFSDELCLNDSDIKLLKEFAEGPAAYTGKLEAQRIEYYKGEIEKISDEAKKAFPLKARLFSSVGLLTGILTAVLII